MQGWSHSDLRRRATEAQLGLEFEVELLECAGVRSGVRVPVRVAESDLPSPSSSFRSRSNPSCSSALEPEVKFGFEFESCRVRLAESRFVSPLEIESEFRFHCAWFGFEFEFEPWKMLSESVTGGSVWWKNALRMLPEPPWKCPRRVSGNAPGRPPWDTRERHRKRPLSTTCKKPPYRGG